MKALFISVAIMFAGLAFTESVSSRITSDKALWSSWTISEQLAYIAGINDGAMQAWNRGMELISKENTQKIANDFVAKSVIVVDHKPLAEAMTTLYSASENEIIPLGDMIYIAQNKVRGHDVTDELRQAKSDRLKVMSILIEELHIK